MLDQFDTVTCIADNLQLVDAAETCANDQGIEFFYLSTVGAIGAVRSAVQRQVLEIINRTHVVL